MSVTTTETTVKKVQTKPVEKSVAKPAIKTAVKPAVKKKAAKPVLKSSKASIKAIPTTKLVQISDLTAQAMHSDTTPPWEVQPTASLPVALLNQKSDPVVIKSAAVMMQRREHDKPVVEPMQRREFDKPAAVKAPVSQTHGLSMSQIRSNIARSSGGPTSFPGLPSTPDRDVGAPYLRQEPTKTAGGISIKDVMQHIARGFMMGQPR
jgi:hypothetical protein